jgi:hypothetical protein
MALPSERRSENRSVQPDRTTRMRQPATRAGEPRMDGYGILAGGPQPIDIPETYCNNFLALPLGRRCMPVYGSPGWADAARGPGMQAAVVISWTNTRPDAGRGVDVRPIAQEDPVGSGLS